jgi:hypothetical protein
MLAWTRRVLPEDNYKIEEKETSVEIIRTINDDILA